MKTNLNRRVSISWFHCMISSLFPSFNDWIGGGWSIFRATLYQRWHRGFSITCSVKNRGCRWRTWGRNFGWIGRSKTIRSIVTIINNSFGSGTCCEYFRLWTRLIWCRRTRDGPFNHSIHTRNTGQRAHFNGNKDWKSCITSWLWTVMLGKTYAWIQHWSIACFAWCITVNNATWKLKYLNLIRLINDQTWLSLGWSPDVPGMSNGNYAENRQRDETTEKK